MSQVGTDFTRRAFPMAAAAVILAGDTVAIITGGGTSSGYATPGAVSTTLRAKGIATGVFYDKYGQKLKMSSPTSSPGDNTTGQDGDILVEVELSFGKNGIRLFRRNNGTSTHACTQADVGSTIYMYDNVTMSRLSSGKSSGGELIAINGDGTLMVQFPLGGS